MLYGQPCWAAEMAQLKGEREGGTPVGSLFGVFNWTRVNKRETLGSTRAA